MLVLARHEGEAIIITTGCGERIVVTATDCRNGKCKIGFVAPPTVKIHRQEVQDAVDREEACRDSN